MDDLDTFLQTYDQTTAAEQAQWQAFGQQLKKSYLVKKGMDLRDRFDAELHPTFRDLLKPKFMVTDQVPQHYPMLSVVGIPVACVVVPNPYDVDAPVLVAWLQREAKWLIRTTDGDQSCLADELEALLVAWLREQQGLSEVFG